MKEEQKIEHVLCDETKVKITTESGFIEVPAIVHPFCKGLSVTMSDFGLFRVTHTPTGAAMSPKYERCNTCLLTLSQFALIAIDNGFSWDGMSLEEAKSVLLKHGSKPVPFKGATSTSKNGTRPLTVYEWANTINHYAYGGIVDEFPWDESDCLGQALENLSSLA